MPFEAWCERARGWLPRGAAAFPADELAAFLLTCRRRVGRASKAELLGVWNRWAACMRTLADNPLVRLHREVSRHIVSGALEILAKVSLPSTVCHLNLKIISKWSWKPVAPE